MKGCITEANPDGQGWVVKNTVYQFFGSNLRIIFEKEGTLEKWCIEKEDWGLSVVFVLEF